MRVQELERAEPRPLREELRGYTEAVVA